MGCVGSLAALAFAVVAWLLWSSYQHRKALERRLGVLERRFNELRNRLTADLEVASQPTEPQPTELQPTETAGSAGLGDPLERVEEPLGAEPSLVAADQAVVPTMVQGPAPESPPAPPSPPPPAAPDSTPPPPARPRIDWEQWIGVRGAAVLGGIVLALAGIYFVRYSIEAGWVPPVVRITLALLAGVAAILAGEGLRKRGYAFSANGLAGAGVVVLYAAIWAGRNLYSLFGPGLAFALMALVTVAGGALSWRHRSQVIALLGLVGGFATPLLISSGSDRPLGLFGYLLLLNVGVAVLGRRTGWSFLGALALGGTVLYQALWIVGRMDSERIWLGLLILGAFVVFYAVVGWLQRRDLGAGGAAVGGAGGPLELLQHAGAVLTPFGFALYFAAQSDLGDHLWPIALLLALLNLAAAFVSRIHRLPFVAPAASAASLGIVFVWSLRASLDASMIWEVVAVLLGLAVLHHLSLEVRAWFGSASWGESLAAAVAAGGALWWLLVVWVGLAERPSAFWVAFGAAGIAALLLLRQSQVTGVLLQEIAAASGLGLHLVAALLLTLSVEPRGPGFSVALLLALATGAAFQAWVLWRRKTTAAPDGGGTNRGREISAAVVSALALLGLLGWAAAADLDAATRELVPFHAGSLLLALLLVLCATRIRSGLGYGLTMALLVLVQSSWTGDDRTEGALLALGLQLLSVVVLSFWPLASRLATAGTRRAAALAGPLWFGSLHELYTTSFGPQTIGLLPIGLGVLSLLAGYGWVRLDARQRDELETPTGDGAGAAVPRESPAQQRRRSTLAWYGGVTLGFVALAIPLQLDKEWITVAWALQGLAVTVLWKRVDHPGLKYFGLALQLAVGLRLIANPALFDYHATGSEPFGLPILNWLLYTYLVPVVALVLSARILEPLELLRLRDPERPLYQAFRQRPAIASLYGLIAIATLFWWINLTIFDAFAAGSALAIPWDRQPIRDLVLSASWALFALGLLMLGVARKSVALRWISLAFFLLTIGKVFLYDLGELEDLFRVASLVGLAFSLIVVSLLYQRFVFGRDRGEGSD